MGNDLCAVYGCKNSWRKTKGRVPKVSYHRFPTKSDQADRRREWIRFCARKKKDGTKWQPGVHSVICSVHFIGNKPVPYPSHPAYLPSIHPLKGHSKRVNQKSALRFQRWLQRNINKGIANGTIRDFSKEASSSNISSSGNNNNNNTNTKNKASRLKKKINLKPEELNYDPLSILQDEDANVDDDPNAKMVIEVDPGDVAPDSITMTRKNEIKLPKVIAKSSCVDNDDQIIKNEDHDYANTPIMVKKRKIMMMMKEIDLNTYRNLRVIKYRIQKPIPSSLPSTLPSSSSLTSTLPSSSLPSTLTSSPSSSFVSLKSKATIISFNESTTKTAEMNALISNALPASLPSSTSSTNVEANALGDSCVLTTTIAQSSSGSKVAYRIIPCKPRGSNITVFHNEENNEVEDGGKHKTKCSESANNIYGYGDEEPNAGEGFSSMFGQTLGLFDPVPSGSLDDYTSTTTMTTTTTTTPITTTIKRLEECGKASSEKGSRRKLLKERSPFLSPKISTSTPAPTISSTILSDFEPNQINHSQCKYTYSRVRPVPEADVTLQPPPSSSSSSLMPLKPPIIPPLTPLVKPRECTPKPSALASPTVLVFPPSRIIIPQKRHVATQTINSGIANHCAGPLKHFLSMIGNDGAECQVEHHHGQTQRSKSSSSTSSMNNTDNKNKKNKKKLTDNTKVIIRL